MKKQLFNCYSVGRDIKPDNDNAQVIEIQPLLNGWTQSREKACMKVSLN